MYFKKNFFLSLKLLKINLKLTLKLKKLKKEKLNTILKFFIPYCIIENFSAEHLNN